MASNFCDCFHKSQKKTGPRKFFSSKIYSNAEISASSIIINLLLKITKTTKTMESHKNTRTVTVRNWFGFREFTVRCHQTKQFSLQLECNAVGRQVAMKLRAKHPPSAPNICNLSLKWKLSALRAAKYRIAVPRLIVFLWWNIWNNPLLFISSPVFYFSPYIFVVSALQKLFV